MSIKTFLVISLVMNVLFFGVLAVYLFSPMLDYVVVNKSLPRLCAFMKKNAPDQYLIASGTVCSTVTQLPD